MRIAAIKRRIDMTGSWQEIPDFERPQVCVKPISYRKFPRSIVFSMYLHRLIFSVLATHLLI
jgi:hypothetical protein